MHGLGDVAAQQRYLLQQSLWKCLRRSRLLTVCYHAHTVLCPLISLFFLVFSFLFVFSSFLCWLLFCFLFLLLSTFLPVLFSWLFYICSFSTLSSSSLSLISSSSSFFNSPNFCSLFPADKMPVLMLWFGTACGCVVAYNVVTTEGIQLQSSGE